MSENIQSVSSRRLLKVAVSVILGLLLLARIGYGQTQVIDAKQAILQGSVQIQPMKSVPGDQTGKIQPGTPIKLTVTVENKGQQASPSGELYLRYAYAHPLENEAESVIFETEKKTLPSIEPGQKVEIAFDTLHQIPSILDFVRYDWSIREYQAIAVIHKEEKIIGSLALTFSAYYYPGIRQEFPAKLSL